ncbi:MAG TPA: hypothetical protein VNX26_13455 [Candidatus Acidoferrum sp.]|nr:hypothetical protein [Candidatus Acidoferrum sp.]
MKKTVFAVALVITLSLSAAAAQHKTPALSHHRAGNPAAELRDVKENPNPSVAALCNPCLFYGGDLNPSDANAAGMSDENTLLIPGGSSTYGEVNIPSGTTVTVKGILFNVQADAAFDPMTASYDIRTGVSEGSGGTSIASGTVHISVAATGNNFLGLNEYSLLAVFPSLTLASGDYWMNVTPNCTNTLDGSCSVFRQFVSNTTSRTNSLHESWQPAHEMFLNSSFFGFTWANWCDASLGFNQTQCGYLSFGVLGGVL